MLDQFVGGGTTLVEARLLNRNVIGVDINSLALERCKATGFWKTNSVKHNFLLLAHEYLFVFKK